MVRRDFCQKNKISWCRWSRYCGIAQAMFDEASTLHIHTWMQLLGILLVNWQNQDWQNCCRAGTWRPRRGTSVCFCGLPRSTVCQTNTCSNLRTSQSRLISTSEAFYIYSLSISIFSIFCTRVTRAVFAFAELTNADPQYRGPEFDFDRIVKDLMNKVRNNGGLNMMDDRFVSAIS